MALTPDAFEPPADDVIEGMFARAWDIIADQDPIDVELRFAPRSRAGFARPAGIRPRR